MVCWKALGPGNDCNVTLTWATHLNIIADPSTAPHGNAALQLRAPPPPPKQKNKPCQTTDTIQEWQEEDDKEPRLMTWPPNSFAPNSVSIHGMQRNRGPTPPAHRTQRICSRCPGTRYHRTPREVHCLCPERSELLWLHEMDVYNIRQLVLML